MYARRLSDLYVVDGLRQAPGRSPLTARQGGNLTGWLRTAGIPPAGEEGLGSPGALMVALATASVAETGDLTRLSIDELARLQVVTVSRRLEARIDAPGAIHVITEEDIRRSGTTTIADALRLSPGVQVSRIDADEWALAVRGFASRLSRSVLVTLDGRSLWTPLFSGVFWDQHDTSMLDLDRIEVNRGPNGALFGANAFNGIITIISKSADQTHGGLANLGLGSAEETGTLRWGGEARPGLHYRAWGQYRRRDGTTAAAPAGYDDAWQLGTGGFRMDWLRDATTVTLQGDAFDGSAGTRVSIACGGFEIDRAYLARATVEW